MIYEGVNFNEEVVSKMLPLEFERAHIEHFWLDRDKQTRKKMLAEVYEKIKGGGKKKATAKQ